MVWQSRGAEVKVVRVGSLKQFLFYISNLTDSFLLSIQPKDFPSRALRGPFSYLLFASPIEIINLRQTRKLPTLKPYEGGRRTSIEDFLSSSSASASSALPSHMDALPWPVQSSEAWAVNLTFITVRGSSAL